MKAAKIGLIVLVVYVGIVVAFESLLGFFQPANQSTLVITAISDQGESNDRVVARLESGGQMYVAANHWPRAWYRQVLANPNVQVTLAEEGGAAVTGDYLAVPVQGAEHDKVNNDNSLGLMFRLLTGFPPRYFVRLEPR
ncbi:MAG: hypothetical protein COA96_05705 [SAR86 cluster bacterium]|uniref:Nitroreductase family deazaflavin-dependent oxidoreductase n=1 Tax=SAR86 cluster bacterium TaxID=2030880 RepID=A0A2A5B5B6_9GAMM|nr:MAG: hypothetical protein COA96_05705 [SAR86 cluster bacterium]